jgi:MFS family permease
MPKLRSELSGSLAEGAKIGPGSPAPTRSRSATLAPFRHRIFLAIWIASLVSNFGSLIQSVGASWLMTSLAPTPDMVALVQAATLLPIMLFSLPAGALADAFDRRLLMIVAQAVMLIASAVLTVFGFLGWIGPWLLLVTTFVIGCGAALNGPAWQASVGDQVPRDVLPAAVALNSLGFNLARTLGPAIGGILVAFGGPQAAFLVNALSYVGLIAVLASWQRPSAEPDLPPERLSSSMSAGLRYVWLSPAIRAVLLRAMAFGFGAAALWALMPLIARHLIGGGPLIYGVLLGSFGSGAVVGALLSTRLRQLTSAEGLVAGSTLAFAVGTGVAGLSDSAFITAPGLALSGAAWVLALSTFNVSVQMSSPPWVLGRALASYQMVAFGSMAVGSWVWGEFAHAYDLRLALLVAAALLAASLILSRVMPLPKIMRLDLRPSHAWKDPDVAVELDLTSGPVVIAVEYRIAQQDWAEFMEAMMQLRRIRRRDGARRWTLLQDLSDPETWVERFQSPSWGEHLRHHRRTTFEDRAIELKPMSLHRGSAPPLVRHLVQRHEMPSEKRQGVPVPQPRPELAPTSVGSMLPPMPNAGLAVVNAAAGEKSE